jgi:hypothetical protein
MVFRFLAGLAHFAAYFLAFFVLFVAVARYEGFDDAGLPLAVAIALIMAVGGAILLPLPWWEWRPVASRAMRVLNALRHFLVWAALLVVLFLAVYWLAPRASWSPVFLVLIVAIGTALVTPFIMGFYLLISLCFRRHWNEAFSSLRIPHYKGFLRLHFDKDANLTVYPIAIDKVPLGGEGPLDAKLIERPIRLLKDVAPLQS